MVGQSELEASLDTYSLVGTTPCEGMLDIQLIIDYTASLVEGVSRRSRGYQYV